MIFGWLIIIVIAFVLLRERGYFHSCTHTAQKDAMDILRERLAKGEISVDEFTKMKESLQK